MSSTFAEELLELASAARKVEGFKWVPGMLGIYKPRGLQNGSYTTRFREGMSVRNMSEWLVPDLTDAATAGALFHQLLKRGANLVHHQHSDVYITLAGAPGRHHGTYLGEACAKAALSSGSWSGVKVGNEGSHHGSGVADSRNGDGSSSEDVNRD